MIEGKVINIPIQEFLEKFKKEYEFLYENNNRVAGYEEAVVAGDEFIENHAEFISEFNKYRGDILSSDREIAAFMFTLESICGGSYDRI